MARKKCPNKEANKTTCPCPEIDCPRRGVCCECIRYHVSHNGRTACM